MKHVIDTFNDPVRRVTHVTCAASIDMLTRDVVAAIASKLAEAFIAEHGAEVLKSIDTHEVATLTIAESTTRAVGLLHEMVEKLQQSNERQANALLRVR